MSRDRQIITRKRNKLTIAAVAGTLTVATAASAAVGAWPSSPGRPAGAAFAPLNHPNDQLTVEQAKLAVARFRTVAEHRAALTADRAAAIPATRTGPADPAASNSPQSTAKSMLAAFGWPSSQFSCLEPLWAHESGWNVTATNPSTGAYGIPQADPGSKMASAGPNWKTDAATQIKWGLTYIKDTYKSPCGAWSHEQADGWY